MYESENGICGYFLPVVAGGCHIADDLCSHRAVSSGKQGPSFSKSKRDLCKTGSFKFTKTSSKLNSLKLPSKFAAIFLIC